MSPLAFIILTIMMPWDLKYKLIGQKEDFNMLNCNDCPEHIPKSVKLYSKFTKAMLWALVSEWPVANFTGVFCLWKGCFEDLYKQNIVLDWVFLLWFLSLVLITLIRVTKQTCRFIWIILIQMNFYKEYKNVTHLAIRRRWVLVINIAYKHRYLILSP